VHLEATMRGRYAKDMRKGLATACIPVKGPLPDPKSAEDVLTRSLQQELLALCASKTKAEEVGC
jgi:hypothetical protein